MNEVLRKAGMYVLDDILMASDGAKIASVEGEYLEGNSDRVRMSDIIDAFPSYVADKGMCNIRTADGVNHMLCYDSPAELRYRQLMQQERINISYEEYMAIFDYLYPEGAGFWDDLYERPYLSILGDPPVPLMDELKAHVYADGESRLKNAFCGRSFRCNKSVIFDCVIANIFKNKRNPMRDYLESLPAWDGISRIGTYFRDLLGATSNLDPDKDREYQDKVMRAWLIGTVARQYESIKFEVIPCLIGPQGLGKSTAIELLSPFKTWYMSTASDITNEKKFLDNIRGHVIVEFGEGKTLKSDPGALKEFISRSSDSYRQSYARYSGDYPRHWGAIVTTNDPTPLVDSTGSRRFFPLFCGEDMDLRIYDPLSNIDREEIKKYVPQLWAEALYRYRIGEKWYFPMDSFQAIVQESASRYNIESDYINSTLDADATYSKQGSKIRGGDIYSIIWPDSKGLPDRAMRAAVHTWISDKECPWRYKVMSMRDDFGVARSVRGYYRMRDAE